MDNLSASARRCMRAMAGTPEDAAAWHNRIADVRAAMRVGVEVMEQSAREEAQAAGKPTAQSNTKMLAASYAIGAVTALECCMSVIEHLHPSLVKANVSADAPRPQNGTNGSRLRPMDLD